MHQSEGLISWCAGQDLNPGHELGRLRCYPYITDARAVEHRPAINRFGVLTGLQKRERAATDMLVRQRLGIAVMFLFLPINGPLWRMALESLGQTIPIGEFSFFALSVLLFVIGALMTFAPELKLGQRP